MQRPVYTTRQNYFFRLPPGEDLLVGLYRVCRENNVDTGVFDIVGAVRSATLGHLDLGSGEIHRQVLESAQDLVLCHGNISPQGDSFAVKAYAVLGDSEGRVSAGQLLAALVYVAEVRIQEFQGQAQARERDPETGLWLWPVV